MTIQKVAVLGSGVMGAAIAAHVANAGVEVLLLDIVPEGATRRNILAETALEKLLKTSPSGFAHPRNAKLVTPGNLDDDIGKLAEVDWVVEAVLERLDVKQSVYRKVDAVRKPGTVVSSNTSTLPLAKLIEGMPANFAKDFLITHFFNPPRFMPLLELVTSAQNDPKTIARIRDFTDVRLGKGVVKCKDTPGFIANRIGCYWLVIGLLEAMKLGLSVEEADSVMGRPVGIPKTGVFGLFDLIGIDLIPLIAKSMEANLPTTDAFRRQYTLPPMVQKMIAEGYTGRKGKGGFYRLNKEGGKKTKESIDLATGQYRAERKASLESVEAAKMGLAALLTHPDRGGRYAWAVLAQTLAYTASLIPEIADDIVAVDEAMRMGYNWKYGPFQLIDRMAAEGLSGPAWFAGHLAAAGMEVPPLLLEIGNQPFYKTEGGKATYYSKKTYHEIHVPEGAWALADIKRTSKPLLKNPSASLWDVGDGIVCLELTSKMNSIDADILGLIPEAVALVAKSYKGMIIGSDADNFSVGANLGFMLYAANIAAWDVIDNVVEQGQKSFMALKYAPFPVVAAMHGMALGGGCEILLHSDAIQAHIESYSGLVELGVGLIPGWGGCKETILRQFVQTPRAGGPMPPISKAFEIIGLAKVSGSAEELKDMGILRKNGGITMNRKRLLADAKARCLTLAENYQPPEPATVNLPGASGAAALHMAIDGLKGSGKASPYDAEVAHALAEVLTGGDTDITVAVTEQQLLDLERVYFRQLIRNDKTLARVEFMLENGKPLKN
jgi:3-hydroxyacyl-CoA dehydrogenase